MSEAPDVIRSRLRRASLRIDEDKIRQRIKDFYTQDGTDRDVDRAARLQRYAKYRMWTEGKDEPWPGASDIPLSDMTEKSLRLQDTVVNAVMSHRPCINANAINDANRAKEKAVDQLIDFQFFVEQPGELIIGEMADAFLNDGEYVLFVPWVKDVRKTSEVRLFDAIPQEMRPTDYFAGIVKNLYPRGEVTPRGKDQPWDFTVKTQSRDVDGNDMDQTVRIAFYTRKNGRVEAVIKGDVLVYDGPRVQVKDFDDVYCPARAANLQPPGPSNPGGAQHVILRDFPTVDEVVRLVYQGFYDLIDEDKVDALGNYERSATGDGDLEEAQRDDLAGKVFSPMIATGAESQKTLTRLTVFDRYDIDGDGLDEDVMWWYLVEPDLLIKAKVLQEMYPLRPDRPRPLAEAALFPVRGRRSGFSLLELLEGIHDAMKAAFDQAMDANTLGIVPFWFYRSNSSMQSEVLRLAPGEGFPLSDPQRDVYMPQIGNPQAQGMALNLITLMNQMGERLAVVGDFQLGRVPAGKSSALRTIGGMSMLAGQGEARPERILRRFFTGLAQAWGMIHDLNQHFLPPKKQIRIAGVSAPAENPYMTIDGVGAIDGRFVFDWQANAFNTSKQQMQAGLENLLGKFVNGLAVQLGISTPETIYNLFRDYAKSQGIDAEARGYMNPANPAAVGPRILAEEAMVMILNDQVPSGTPLEQGGWIEHLQKLMEFEAQLTDPKTDTGELTPEQAMLLQQYKLVCQQHAAQQQQQMQTQQAAQQFAQQQGQGGAQPGRPPQGPPPDVTGNQNVGAGNDLLDESMPTAGGGGNA